MFRLCVAFGLTGVVIAAPLKTGEFSADGKTTRAWQVPGGQALALAPGAAPTVEINVPELTDKEREAGGNWRGLLSVDVFGTAVTGNAGIELAAIDPLSGDVIGSGTATINRIAPRAAWTVISSSAQPGSEAANLFDADPKTSWHTRYGKDQARPPHWVGLEFGKPRTLEVVRYLPRIEGTNGRARKYRFEIRKPGKDWEIASQGEAPNQPDPIAFSLPAGSEIEAFRFVIESDWSGEGFGAIAGIEVPGVELKPEPPVTAGARAWTEIPAPLMEKLVNKRFGLRVKNVSKTTVVVGTPRFERLHTAPSEKLFGRSNGGLGPDKIGAGLLGFDAMTEHEQTSLPVMTVRSGSPAAKAGLKPGDAILAVSGKPLPVNDLAPGWTWFQFSHEACIGRATEAALAAGGNSLPVTVMREGEVKVLEIPLERRRAFGSMNPADDMETAAMLKDSLSFLEKSQKDNGSWSDDMIRTSFSALALMATGENKAKSRVRKAVDWALEKYPKPEAYGNLGFWAGSYAGILYSEWYLATGDARVLPHLDALRDWAVNGQHPSAWQVPALGHGPSGLPYENKALVAPACHLLLFESLAKRCGMKSGIWELLMPYMQMSWSDPKEGGHGSLGYNRSYKDTEEFWSRSGLFAMASHLRNERTDMRDSMTGFMRKNHPWFRNSHAYGEPGGSLGLLGLNLASPDAFKEVFPQYRWWFALAWEPGYGLRFTTPHMGAPYMGEDDLINATYALVLQARKANLHITGSTRKGMWK